MKIYSPDDIPPEVAKRRPVATIGNFDGVHLGHKALFAELRRRAEALGRPSAVVTFEPHPLEVLRNSFVLHRLTPPEEKRARIAESEVDYLLCIEFTRELGALTPEDFFAKYIWETLQPADLLIGYDFHFGKNREGNYYTLKEIGERDGFEVDVFDAVAIEGGVVSSSAIREALEAGDVVRASHLLGRNYSVSGPVVHGDAIGRTIGYPTANIDYGRAFIPPPGVYAVRASVEGDEPLPAVANVGFRPTIEGDRPARPILEVHLFDFEGDIYGKSLNTWFVERLRGEAKFNGLDELIAKIDEDCVIARKLLAAGWITE